MTGPWLKVITPKIARKLDEWKRKSFYRSYELRDSNFDSVIVWLYDGNLQAGMYVDSSNVDLDWDELIIQTVNIDKNGGYEDAATELV